jgi:hypothetical protein
MTTTTTTRPRRTTRDARPGTKVPVRTDRARRDQRTAGTSAATPGTATARGARTASPPRTPFALLVVGLLSGALISLLLLNTVLAQDAFTLTELQHGNQQLIQQRQALQEEIAREESPSRLSRRAKALGMSEPGRLAFVDAQTGQVVGPRVRPVPDAAAAAAAAAGVVGVPGATVPGDGVSTYAQPEADQSEGTRSEAAGDTSGPPGQAPALAEGGR